MTDKNIAAACGLYCGDCEHLGGLCHGCGSVEGKPFWTAQMKVDVCPLYGCCVGTRQLEHCGLCDELPCDTFNSFHDPALSEEEARKSVLDRRDALLKRRDIGTDRWLEEKRTC